MKKFLSFLVSRLCLALLALVIIGLMIWFVGPFVALGELKPLASVGLRILVLALLLSGLLLWLADLSISTVFVALLCLLIWGAGPLLSFGDTKPFRAESARFIAISVVLLVLAIYWGYRLWRRMRTDKQFLTRLLQLDRQSEEMPATDSFETVRGKINNAVERLKSMRIGVRGLGHLFKGSRYLYELPWYVTLGSKEAGKTAALLNAGLLFPVAEQMQRAAGQLARSNGTTHVDCWLTNEAVLIDTGGRYTRHGIAGIQPEKMTTAQPDATPVNKVGNETLASTADAAEWQGFLGLLRKHRPRAPINGVLLVVDLLALTSQDESIRLAEASSLRARLAELRLELGVRFPVYLMITKMDRLTGFMEYFGSLTIEGRSRVWGFTLSNGKKAVAKDGLRARCRAELDLLAMNLADGINLRLHEEYEVLKRKRLLALSEEFSALAQPLCNLIEHVFADSRYDATQQISALRGVYFTSAVQTDSPVIAQRHTVVQHLWRKMGATTEVPVPITPGHHSYFLHDLLTQIIFREAHLVRPNLRWEFRFRLLRLAGHALVLLCCAWLAGGVWLSRGHNRAYLAMVEHKTQALTGKVRQWYQDPNPKAVPDTLGDARDVASYPGLDWAAPSSTFRYGLYTAPAVAAVGRNTYDALEDKLLLPSIVQRMESVLSDAIANKDPQTAYDTLRIYLMLQDSGKYRADEVKAWVLADWTHNDSAALFGDGAAMLGHVEQLFSGARVVQSPLAKNALLIQQARAFLDTANATQRLYERAKAAMSKDAPDEFTLLRAVGPQAGTVFTRAGGEPLTRGVPGLFTYDGYHKVFDQRLPEFVQAARDDDAWVMGRSLLGAAQKKSAEIADRADAAADPLTLEIRRLYLNEYAQRWDDFLGDIRTITGTSLAFNLQILQRFAAPDSPLTRLAWAAVKETTLTGPVAGDDTSLLQKASGQRGLKADRALGISAEARLTRARVDNHFAALREVVTGHAGQSPAIQFAAGPSQLDSLSSQLNGYYTVLTVSDNALTNNSMPPASDTAVKLKLTADTMPAPFHQVLLDLATQGSREVDQGIGQLLSRQMVATIGDTCRLTIEGHYPFVDDGRQDVSIDDFTRMFAQGGVLDDFFTKTLAPFVDTSARPWRYKTLPGATEAVQGPDLKPFEQAREIREVFFSDPGQKTLAWHAAISIPELDPNITGLALDIDGRSILYQHGPVMPFVVTWPGPRGGAYAEITAKPRIRPDTSTLSADGPWALMHLLQRGRLIETATSGRTRAEFVFDGRQAVLDITSPAGVANPLTGDVLRAFHCPSSMPMFNVPDSGPPPGLPAM